MSGTKISAAADAGTLVATDMLPLARSGSTTALHATMAEMSAYANAGLPVASTSVLGAVKIDGSSVTIASGVISAAGGTPYTLPPAMDGTAAVGTAGQWSRGDHVHPTDTSRAATGAIPGAASTLPAMDGTAAVGALTTYGRADHVHPSDTSRVAKTGDTMSGLLTLSGVPTVSLHAATKGYVDTATGGSTAAIPGASYADNGGFAINQRSYVSGTALAAGVFGHDRWKAGAGGCTYTFTQSGNPATTITITAGSLQQVVEGAALVGGTYTLSWTGTAQGRVGGGSYAASPVTASVTASANTTVEFNAGSLGMVKFEAGSTATPWVANAPQQDLAKCQRFYQSNLTIFSQLMAAGAGSIGAGITLPVTMRATPTIVITGTGGSLNVTTITASAQGSSAATSTASVPAAGTAVLVSVITASADL